MKCPYSGKRCLRCIGRGKCELDTYRDQDSGRLLIDLDAMLFTCKCGEKIRTPVHPCKTKGCEFSENVS